jgi:hypothetical protein
MRSTLILVGLVLAGSPFLGCTPNKGDPPPPTHKVEGKVVYPGGRPFTAGGMIGFIHETFPGVTTTAEIKKEDGTFALHTIVGQHRVAGAQEGPHAVLIRPLSQDQNVQFIHLKKKFVVVPGDNHFTVEIED